MQDIFGEMERMHRMIDEYFDRLMNPREISYYQKNLIPYKDNAKLPTRIPVTELTETEKEIIAHIEIPGVGKDDIELNVAEDYLEVKANRKQESKSEKKGSYSYSMSQTSFYRRIPLNQKVVVEKSEAEYKNGVLTIRMPKLQKSETKTKKIQVK